MKTVEIEIGKVNTQYTEIQKILKTKDQSGRWSIMVIWIHDFVIPVGANPFLNRLFDPVAACHKMSGAYVKYFF